ncbi:NAD(P)/FAD-dependent oxidoreductase [Marinobacter qingdaonensis]|jgi:nitrite reductase (NADH) large subunit|uniref:FAD-dependent oxidoreductase n=1 Tax=Marinobacter qingdaonensis TaxID=3108486 RepID=A0ABU5NWE9_9GAMM|nr:FAD-dependent oxidoreductase [Marinobacter sp. ASW11-75]MEA1080047.1 FAD-dependent oxidoreductase [Marinobacter sp. ASW11-75]
MAQNSERTLVVCGHGMVAQRFLEELVDQARVPFQRIVVFNGEARPAYNRIQLSALLSGDAEEDSLTLKPDDWFDRHGITVHHGEPVQAIDRQDRTVITATGRRQHFDTLVLATGSRPGRLGIPGEDLAGVRYFRDLDDTHHLIGQSQSRPRAVVIGGGFLGLEAAVGLQRRGVSVTVLHRSGHLLNRQLDTGAGQLLAEALTDKGLNILTGTSPLQLLGRDAVRAVQLSDQTLISADLVVIATGIVPNRELAEAAGLDCGRGIRVDARLQTSDPDIYALGECCELDDQTFGLVEPGYLQAQILAQVLATPARTAGFQHPVLATRLKISDLPVFSCGLPGPASGTESLISRDLETGRYSHLLVRDNRLVGAILLGHTGDGPWYQQLIAEGTDITPFRAQLPFGKPFCEAAA